LTSVEDGITFRDRIRSRIKRAEQSGNAARVDLLRAEIKQKPLPIAAYPVWLAFCRLSGRRGGTGFGPSPIGWLEIEAYQRLAGIRLSPWEIEMIEMLDRLYLDRLAAVSEAARNKERAGG
jgi:hypothetical protein